MEKEYIAPFVQGTQEMLSMMVGIDCSLSEETRAPAEDSISGTIKLSGEAEGRVTLAFPIETATKIVCEMLGMEEEEMDQKTSLDSVGEMANIVAGNAKTSLSKTAYHSQLSLPEIAVGGIADLVPQHVTDPTNNCLHTDLGDFSLICWMTHEGQ